MDILDNPFRIIGANPRDDRRRIMELTEEKSLLSDEEDVATAGSSLTNLRDRLAAEVSWLPGVGPRRASEAIDLIKNEPLEVFDLTNIPPLARANLLSAALIRVIGKLDNDELADWVIELAGSFDQIDSESTLNLINEERSVAGFRVVLDNHAIESELQDRRQHYRATIRDALNFLSPKDLVEVVTDVIETVTESGETNAPILIDDMVDIYEVAAQEFLEQEASNIEQLVEKARDAVDAGEPDASLGSLVNELIEVVKNWDTVAQPIQVNTKSRGLDHASSQQVAGLVRDLAIHLFNEHRKLELSQQLMNMLQEVFAEVVDVAERTAEDADKLDDIAEKRKFSSLLDPISDLCRMALENAERKPSAADREAQKVIDAAPELLSQLSSANVPGSLISQGKDELSLTLMQCAVIYGNETNKWKQCVSILGEAMKYASSPEAQQRNLKNLHTASQNYALYGDLTPITSAPSLRTINGIGLTLYGCTDEDVSSRSHLATYYFVVLFIPVFPICRYRVIPTESGYRFLGKAPLRTIDKWHLWISVGLILLAFIGFQ